MSTAVCTMCGVPIGNKASNAKYCQKCAKAAKNVRKMLARKHGGALKLRSAEFESWKKKYQKKHGVLHADTVKEINSDYDKQLENSVLSRRKFYSSDDAMQALKNTGDMQVCERLHLKASALPCGLCYGCQGCPKVPEYLRGPVRREFGAGDLLPHAFVVPSADYRFNKGAYKSE